MPPPRSVPRTRTHTHLRAADWPQLFGPTRDGHSTETKLNWDWPKDGPPVAWKKDIGTGWAGPVVAGDTLLLFHRVGDDEVLVALDPRPAGEVDREVRHEVPRRL